MQRRSASIPKDQPTVLLIKTVKGYGMGKAGEGKNTAHQAKQLSDEDVRNFRDRFNIPIPDSELKDLPFVPSFNTKNPGGLMRIS